MRNLYTASPRYAIDLQSHKFTECMRNKHKIITIVSMVKVELKVPWYGTPLYVLFQRVLVGFSEGIKPDCVVCYKFNALPREGH